MRFHLNAYHPVERDPSKVNRPPVAFAQRHNYGLGKGKTASSSNKGGGGRGKGKGDKGFMCESLIGSVQNQTRCTLGVLNHAGLPELLIFTLLIYGFCF
jgi:hypothetical protein